MNQNSKDDWIRCWVRCDIERQLPHFKYNLGKTIRMKIYAVKFSLWSVIISYYAIIGAFTSIFLLLFLLWLWFLLLFCCRLLLHFLSFLFRLFGLFWLLWLLLFLFFWFLLLRLFFFNIWNEVSSNYSLENLWNSKPVFGLIIFEYTAKSSFSCTKCSIEHMNILFLFILNKTIFTSFFLAPHLTSRFLDW